MSAIVLAQTARDSVTIEPPPAILRVRTGDLQRALALRNGDVTVLTDLVDRHHAAMVRLAMVYVGDEATAEDVAQETWIAVLSGIAGYEGRSSLKNWIFGILVNRARTRARCEARQIPFSSLRASDPGSDGAAADAASGMVEPRRGRWASPADRHEERPEDWFLSHEVRQHVLRAVAGLPPRQRRVMELRDLECRTAAEVTALLGVSGPTQRVILHRARARVRAALRAYVYGDRTG
jgi:RNA polymerase sigma-70 factor (ECF subfamily)